MEAFHFVHHQASCSIWPTSEHTSWHLVLCKACRPFVNHVMSPVCPERHVWCSHLNLSCCINLWECYLWKWQHINYKTNSDISRPLCGLGVQLSSLRFSLWKRFRLRELAPIVAKLDSAIHRINHYSEDRLSKFWITHGVQAFSDEWGKISAQAHTLICIHLWYWYWV